MSLFSTRIVNRRLGPEVIGLVVFSTTLSGILVSASDFGMTSTIIREVAARRQETSYLRDVIRSASLFAWTVFAALALVVMSLVGALGHHWLDLDPAKLPALIPALRLFFLSALLVLPRLIYGAVLQGLQRFRLYNIVELGWAALQQAGTLLIAAGGGAAVHIAAWYLTCSAVAVVAEGTACATSLGWRTLIPGWSSSAFAHNRRFLFHSVATSVFASIFQRLDRLVLSLFLPVGTLAHYGFTSGLVSKALSFVSGVARASYPAFAAAVKDGVNSVVEIRFRKVDDIVSIGTVPLFAFVVYFERPVITYVFGSAVANALWLPTVLLALGSYLNSTLHIPYRLSLALGKPEIAARHNAYSIPVIVPLTILLVWRFGVVGAASSWVLYHLFAYAYAVPRYWRECFGREPGARYARIASVVAAAVASYGLPLAALAGRPPSLVTLVVMFAGGTASFLTLAFLFLASPEMKSGIRSRLSLQR
jgi:O-antigen/teichoic acid export membrane protein